MQRPTAMVAPLIPDIVDAKRAARERALVLRSGCDPRLGGPMARHLLAVVALSPGAAVAGFWPIGSEIDVVPLLWALHARGCAVLLPETPRRGNALIFRHWRPGIEMVPERFGTFRPAGEIGVPEVLLMPLLAFDRAGRRLGYGGGFYDRTLAGLPGARAIGCAYAAQELDEVPATDYDARLDAVATERGVIVCERS